MTADPSSGLERLNALFTPDLWSLVDGENPAAVIGWGTTFYVAHLVRGIRTLHVAAQCSTVFPLMRTVMEYAVGTIWLADAGEEAVAVLNRKLVGSQRKLSNDLSYIDLDTAFPSEVVQAFREKLAAQLAPYPGERLSAFRHLLEEYGFEQMIPVYNVTSGLSHLSLEGAQIFFRQSKDGTRLSQHPFNDETVPCEVVCLGMQFSTMLAYNELLDSRPWTTELKAIAEQHGLTTEIARKVGSLHASRMRPSLRVRARTLRAQSEQRRYDGRNNDAMRR